MKKRFGPNEEREREIEKEGYFGYLLLVFFFFFSESVPKMRKNLYKRKKEIEKKFFFALKANLLFLIKIVVFDNKAVKYKVPCVTVMLEVRSKSGWFNYVYFCINLLAP